MQWKSPPFYTFVLCNLAIEQIWGIFASTREMFVLLASWLELSFSGLLNYVRSKFAAGEFFLCEIEKALKGWTRVFFLWDVKKGVESEILCAK
jgi:hypothetical protein